VAGPWPGADLRARRVLDGEPLARRGRRPRQELGAAVAHARNVDSPRLQVPVDLELDRGELHPQHPIEVLGEQSGPAAGLPAEDRRQRLTLPLVGALVDDEPAPCLRLRLPDVADEMADSRCIEASSPTSP
jgi:hypothetical protein